MSDEDRPIVRDSERYFCSVFERSCGFDEAPEQAQILRVRSDVIFRIERRYVDSGDERETLRAMLFDTDGDCPLGPN